MSDRFEEEPFIIRRRKALSVAEILMELEDSDSDDDIDTVAAIPPEKFDGLTDEEDIDDEELHGEEPLKKDMAGTFEYETTKDRQGLTDFADNAPSVKLRQPARTSSPVHNEALSVQTLKRAAQNVTELYANEGCETVENVTSKLKLPSAFSAAQWKKVAREAELSFKNANMPELIEELQLAVHIKMKDKSPSEIFDYFFDSQVCELIVAETKLYALQHDAQFAETFNAVLPKRFIGILILCGYNKLPQISCYWSTNPTLGSPIVKQTMPRSMFRKIKQYLHFQDNNKLDLSDKYTKLRELFDIINIKFMQFGVFEEHLSIDEQMLPYFGRHSCKMYIRSKPVKFGFKTWCMAGSTGYVFRMLPYGGASDKYDKNLGLGASVVMDMIAQLEFLTRHQIYFDNFFTSHYLMCLLGERGICATGTVRNNRLGKPAPDLKSGKVLPKGEFDAKFDEVNKIVCCRWQDKREVTLLSNFTGVHPLTSTKRRQRQKEGQSSQVIVQQPNLIRNYNSFMGGVDLHDNAVANYRISIRSKKWWWPLWLGILESSMVNAWKLNCLINKKSNRPKIPQLTYRVELATKLLLTPDENNDSNVSSPSESEEDGTAKAKSDPNLPRVSGQHQLVVQPEKKARRCKVCHKPTQRMCSKCQVHLHLQKCFAIHHNWQEK